MNRLNHALLPGICLLILCLPHPTATAAQVFSAIQFTPPQTVIDTASGNGVNFYYRHLLENLEIRTAPQSGFLSLTHQGNQNTGPRGEVWNLFGPDQLWIGTLSESLTAPRTDTWKLPEVLLAAWNPDLQESGFDFYLAESTPYNSEKITLLQSKLRLGFPNHGSPSSPEPSSLLFLSLGLAFIRAWPRIQGQTLNGDARRSGAEK